MSARKAKSGISANESEAISMPKESGDYRAATDPFGLIQLTDNNSPERQLKERRVAQRV